jgi:hypothetical protein
MVITFFEEIFPYEKFPVEFECYKQLKDSLDINYIAIPWTQILNSHWLMYPSRQPAEYYFRFLSKQKIKQKNNFTVCQHDSYMLLELYYKHLNITKVFTPLHSKYNTIDNIQFIPIPFTSSFSFKEVTKDILFSFVGTYTSHPIRERMKDRIVGSNIIYRNQYHIDPNMFNTTLKAKEEKEYQSVLERSRFSLCPRGSSPSSVRFWESLQAGAIPVLISDDWALPDWDWSDTIIQIQEKDFEKMTYTDLQNILTGIDEETVNKMKSNCLKAYSVYKKENFSTYIKNNL